MSLGFGTELVFKWLCPWCSQWFSLLPPEDEQVSAVWKGATLAAYRAFTGQTDRQTIQSTSYRHCLSPSSMDSSPCPALMHHGGFNALHAKNTVKNGGEQKNNLFGTLENGKNELNWTENTTLWHSHTKNKLLLTVIFRQFPLTFYLKVTWTRLIVPFSTF